MDELLGEFLTETNESLSVLDTELVELERNPNDPELLSNIFRLMHTIKGTCGFLGLPRLEAVAHAGENVLGKVRDGELTITPEAVSLILECLDRIRVILDELAASQVEPEGDDQELVGRLNQLAEGGQSPGDASGDNTVEPCEPEVTTPEPANEGGSSDPVASEAAANVVEMASPPTPGAGEETILEQNGPEDVKVPPAAVAAAPADSPKPSPAKSAQSTPANASKDAATKEAPVVNQSIRVNVDVLENLMTMVSELVLTRNQLLQILRGQKESEFSAPLQRLNHVVSELQEGVMQTRMQPIGNAWAKLPRVLRDLSHELGKKIELVMKGAETELDRQVLELIKDPLTHMVRNSADHGLESPAERLAAGKPEVGTVTLNAFHEGGHIIIEISDNGRGLNVDRIKDKVVANGLASESELDALSDQQVMQHIFKPGFSTAQQVTAVSGRGVGMDVVRTNIEKIGGTIELASAEGKGTCFTIKIPLTLAIVSALIVECRGERFAIPQISVIELVRASSQSDQNIEQIKDTPVLRLRNRLLPLVNLGDLLRLPPATEGDGTSDRSDDFIVVTQVGNYTFGIIVDRVFDTEEIVVKPVAPILRDIQLFSGNTILGDGSVVMILDPNGIAAATGEITVADANETEGGQRPHELEQENVAMLVFKGAGDGPKAVPLGLVARLEEFDCKTIEFSGDRNVVQYRGQLMPLIHIDAGATAKSEGMQPVLVFTDRERSMGLVVDEIVDIIEDRLNVELTSERPGFIGSAIISGQATDIIDTGYYLTQAFSDWFGTQGDVNEPAFDGGRVLLVDDSDFFRNLMTPLLSAAGYEVIAATTAEHALQICQDAGSFDVIVSDIEMPGMDGFALAKMLKDDARWSETPIVALSSHTGPQVLNRGREAGFSDYVAKFDRDGLLMTLKETIATARSAA